VSKDLPAEEYGIKTDTITKATDQEKLDWRVNWRGEENTQMFCKEYKHKYERPTDKLNWHLRRQWSPDSKHRLFWWFFQYGLDAWLDWFQIDFDNHDGLNEEQMHKSIRQFISIIESIGGTIVWTTSPGDIINGKHVQGRYGYVRLDRRYSVEYLRSLTTAIKQKIGITDEYCWQSKFRNIRLLGQQWVEVCDPITGELVDPVGKNEPQIKSMDVASEAWCNSKAINLDDLLALPDLITIEPTKASKASKVAHIQDLDIELDNEDTFTPHTDWTPARDDTSMEVFEHDTLKVIRNEVARQVRYTKGLATRQQLIDLVMLSAPKLRPTTSKTVNNPAKMKYMISSCVDYFLPKYPEFMKNSKKTNWSYTRELLFTKAKSLIKQVQDEDESITTGSLITLFIMLLKWNGFAAAKVLYDSPDALFTRNQWSVIKKVLFYEMREHIKPGLRVEDGNPVFVRGKCTQYALKEALVKTLSEKETTASSSLTPTTTQQTHTYVYVSRECGIDLEPWGSRVLTTGTDENEPFLGMLVETMRIE
jgi:hypothetical protein